MHDASSCVIVFHPSWMCHMICQLQTGSHSHRSWSSCFLSVKTDNWLETCSQLGPCSNNTSYNTCIAMWNYFHFAPAFCYIDLRFARLGAMPSKYYHLANLLNHGLKQPCQCWWYFFFTAKKNGNIPYIIPKATICRTGYRLFRHGFLLAGMSHLRTW